MSVVTSAVVVVSYAPTEVTQQITEPLPWGSRGFAAVDARHCGGDKVLQSTIYAAGFNYVDPDELRAWFLALPWGAVGKAVLVYDTEGDGRTVVCTPGWEPRRLI